MQLLSQARVLSKVKIEDRTVVFQCIVKVIDCLGIEIIGSEAQRSTVIVTLNRMTDLSYGLYSKLVVGKIQFLQT